MSEQDNIDEKYIKISDYIYDNFYIVPQEYIEKSNNLIEKYKKIWPSFEYKRIISNIIALNLFIYIY